MTETLRAGPLLQIRDLCTVFESPDGVVRAADGVSFDVGESEIVALVGESGCGKSATALSILRLIDPPGRIASGSIRLRERELLTLTEREMRAVRGREIPMVFQEPTTALNPLMTVGRQVMEVFQVHQDLGRSAARRTTVEVFRMVGIPAPEERIDQYPHQLSGGMRQRVMLSMALACRPALIVADEPTTALDVTIQAQILDLLDKLRRDLRVAILLITHDLAVVAETAQRIVVMYAGQVVETSPCGDLFRGPTYQRPAPGNAARRAAARDSWRRARPPAPAGMVPLRRSLPARLRPLHGGVRPARRASVRPLGALLPLRGGAAMTESPVLLEVDKLRVHFRLHEGWGLGRRGVVRAVDGVSFTIAEGETLGLVGESGCGKSTLGRAVLRLVGVTAGKVRFAGTDILKLSARRMRSFRRHMQVIFQDPFGSLNPRLRVLDIVGEAVLVQA